MSTVNVRCVKGHVLLEPVYPKNEGRIFTGHIKPDDMPPTARVLSIGARPLTKKGAPVDLGFKIGDLVVLKRFTCLWVELRGRNLISTKQHEVLAVIEE